MTVYRLRLHINANGPHYFSSANQRINKWVSATTSSAIWSDSVSSLLEDANKHPIIAESIRNKSYTIEYKTTDMDNWLTFEDIMHRIIHRAIDI